MADYFITGIWFDEQRTITHVMLHGVDKKGNWYHGKKTKMADAVLLIDAGYTLETRVWSYQLADWAPGAPVIVVNENRRRFLRSAPQTDKTLNLNSLIRMKALADPFAR